MQNGNQKKARVVILLSYQKKKKRKITFKIQTVRKDKKGHHIMIKVSIQEYL